MQPPSLGLWILFLWIKATVNGTEVMGIIGSVVELRCHYPERLRPTVQFRVTWQIEGENECLVDASFPPNEKKQCARFINRTRLSDQLMQGDFTLQMFNISHDDEHTYTCHIQQKKKGMFMHINRTSATLKVAAHYSKPILTGPVEAGEEVKFTCSSSQGYPEPKVYWINLTDNSPLKGMPMERTREPSGTFSVFSTLIIKGASSGVKVGCVIENERLHENLTIDPYSVVAGNLPNSSPTSEPETQTPSVSHALAGSIVTVLLVILLGICWWYKRRSSRHQTYATPAEMMDFQRQCTAEEIAGGAEAVP